MKNYKLYILSIFVSTIALVSCDETPFADFETNPDKYLPGYNEPNDNEDDKNQGADNESDNKDEDKTPDIVFNKSAMLGVWVQDGSFTSNSNYSIEFKSQNSVAIFRQFGGKDQVKNLGTGTYLVLNDNSNTLYITRDGETTEYLVKDLTKDSFTLNSVGKEVKYVRSSRTAAAYARPVDLGLPSGTYWSDLDLGSFTLDDISDVYQWGATTIGGSYLDRDTDISGTGWDTAYNISKKWRMPTEEQWRELMQYCEKSTDPNNNNIHYLTGPNGNKITFTNTKYWLGSSYSSYSSCRGYFYSTDYVSKSNEYPIRPVFN